MKYWDASAVVPLIHQEPTSAALLAVYASDADHTALTTTRVEVECVIARLLHEGKIAAIQAVRLRNEARKILNAFSLVAPGDAVIESAVRLARAHPIDLRAGDALHLAAWQTVSGGDPQSVEFVCNDKRLVAVALAEGATVLP